jgi:hypothetical protein
LLKHSRDSAEHQDVIVTHQPAVFASRVAYRFVEISIDARVAALPEVAHRGISTGERFDHPRRVVRRSSIHDYNFNALRKSIENCLKGLSNIGAAIVRCEADRKRRTS